MASRTAADNLDLNTILNDRIFCTSSIKWKDIGLQLGLSKHELDIIEADYRRIEEQRREMIDLWLRSSADPTLEKLHEAIRRVNDRHQGEVERARISADETNAVEAVYTLLTLLDKWEITNRKIYSAQDKLVTQLHEEKCWMPAITRKWKKEDLLWEHGSMATKKDNIRRVLNMGRNFQGDRFVREFLQEKGFATIPNEKVIIGLLRQALVDIEAETGKKLVKRYRQILMHQKRLADLNIENKAITEKMNERSKVYCEIKRGLDQIGAKQKRIEKLNVQLNELTKKKEDCVKLKRNCEEIEHDLQEKIIDTRRELDAFLSSLDRTINQMTLDEEEFASLLQSIWYGMMVGASAGHNLVPFVGGVVGGVVGGIVGGVNGMAKLMAGQSDDSSYKIYVDNYKESIAKGRAIHSELTNVLA